MNAGKLSLNHYNHDNLGPILELRGPLEISNYSDNDAEEIVVRISYETATKLSKALTKMVEAHEAKIRDSFCGAI